MLTHSHLNRLGSNWINERITHRKDPLTDLSAGASGRPDRAGRPGPAQPLRARRAFQRRNQSVDGCEIHFAPQKEARKNSKVIITGETGNHGKTWETWRKNHVGWHLLGSRIIAGFIRCCRISSIHSRSTHFVVGAR